ncbi:hypothetical protein WJX82_005276 [Trebouxia sp. C0006]
MLVSDLAGRPARPARSRVLRLRGLPYRALEDDIFRFLEPLIVTRVHICKKHGRPTGEAYVQFASRHGAGEALGTKNRQHLGNRYIEIFAADEFDFGHSDGAAGNHAPASSSDNAQHAEPITAVKVAGLSSTATVQDVVSVLDGVELRRGLDSAVFLDDQRGGRAALVELANDTALQLALSKNNQFSTDGSTLELRGLPCSATASDILQFFEGFHLNIDNIHLETEDDWQGNLTCTGLAYVQFAHPTEAEQAKQNKHKQMIGTLCIECMIFVPGRQYANRLTAGPGARPLLLSPFQMQPRPESSGAQPSGAAPVFPARMPDVSMGSLDWSRPYSLTLPSPARNAFEGRPGFTAFQRASDQFERGVPEGALPGGGPPARDPPFRPVQAMQQMGSATPGGMQGPLPFGLQQQQQQWQQLLVQQQFAMQQQQQLMMQQQAMQQEWRGQQWHGGVTPLGMAQGWIRPYPMGLPQPWPLQLPLMVSRGPSQGGMGMGMSGEGMAYGYRPGPEYAWAPMHPANPPMIGAGVQFPTGHQGGLGIPYPPAPNPLDSRLAQSPHGGRAPARGNFRTLFPYQPQSRLSQSHSGSLIQRSSDSHVSSQLAVSAGVSSGESATAGGMTELEAVSVADNLGGRRLSPIMTHAVLSPSDVILASTARSRAAELTAVTLSQMTEPFPSASAPLQSERQ